MADSIKKKRGRPKGYRTKTPHSKRLAVNVTPDQLSAFKESAEKSDITFSAWVRKWLDYGAERDSSTKKP